jgi:hypothetical protein
LVRPLVSEAPLQDVNGIITVSLEKLLVDVFSNAEFYFVRGMETEHIFNNAFSKYSVNTDKLMRYADRKKRKPELLKLTKKHSL